MKDRMPASVEYREAYVTTEAISNLPIFSATFSRIFLIK